MRIRSRLSVGGVVYTATMADITFLLIIFFLLTTTFARDTGLDITLPKAMSSQNLPKREVTIWVNREGEIRVGEDWVTPANLRDALARVLGDAEVKTVTIRGDERVPYGTIVTVIDTANLLGAGITIAAEIAPTQGAGAEPGTQ